MRKGDTQDRGILIWHLGDGKILKFRCNLEKYNPRYNLWDVSCPQMRGSMLFTFDKKNVYGIYSDYPKNLNKKQLEIFDKATNNFWRKYYHLNDKKEGLI
jgi:trehalose utilization protein